MRSTGLCLIAPLLALTLPTTPGPSVARAAHDGSVVQDGDPERQGRTAATLRLGDDRLAAGFDVAIVDSVAGDLMAAGGAVSVSGPVGGDLLAAGGSVTASGPVGGSVRAAAGQLTVSGAVGRNVTITGGAVRVARDGTVQGNAYLSGGEVTIDGRIAGHVRGTAEVVRLTGRVDGSVDVTAERVIVGPDAVLAGGLVHRSPEPAEVAASARIEGPLTHRPAEGDDPLAWWIGQLLRLGAFLLTGAVLVALFPDAVGRLRDTLLERPWPSMGLGLAALVVLPFTLLLVGVTVVGIPLMLIGGGLFTAALYVSRAVVAVWIGDRIVGDGTGRTGVVGFLVGGALLALAGLLPWVGWAVTLLATLAGFGAGVELLTRRWRQGAGAAR